jgi:hypothetical protein
MQSKGHLTMFVQTKNRVVVITDGYRNVLRCILDRHNKPMWVGEIEMMGNRLIVLQRPEYALPFLLTHPSECLRLFAAEYVRNNKETSGPSRSPVVD